MGVHQYLDSRHHLAYKGRYNTSRCVTRTLLPWLLTMAPACARLDSLEMTLPELSSPPLSAVPATRESWSVWDRRTPLSTESSPTGTIWRRSGTTPSTTSSVLPLRSSPSSPCTPPDVPPVLSWTPVTVSPTVSPSTRVTLSPTPLSVLTWLAVSSPTT